MNPSEADFVVGGIRVNTFSTTWNMLRLWQCKGSRDQGGMRWQASWMLQTSEPETFAAECACKRDKQVTIQVLPKASSLISLSLIKQERSECSVDTCCDWCHSLPAEIWVFRHQITTRNAAHRCKSWLLLSWSMDKIPAVHPVFLIHGHIGLESMMCKVLSRQRVFMKQVLGHRVTLRSSPRQDDQNLNLVNSYVGPAETALVSSTCMVTGRSFQQVTWRPVKHRFIEFCLIYCICEQKQRFCWLPSVSYHLELEQDDLKNIWSETEMMNCHMYLILRSESETASVREQLHQILAALWSEECLCLMS